MDQPTTAAECVELLNTVLAALDAIVERHAGSGNRALAFAAVRVQEALDLLEAREILET